MANPIEATSIDPLRFVTVSSRYAGSRVFYYTQNRLLTFGIYKKPEIPVSQDDQYYVVNAGTEYRPDLISQMAYGTVDFWWRIMEANGIKDVYQIKSGLNLRIPPAGLV